MGHKNKDQSRFRSKYNAGLNEVETSKLDALYEEIKGKSKPEQNQALKVSTNTEQRAGPESEK